MRCPGQDTRFWQPGDIYNIVCPKCGNYMEFFKDDTRRTCKNCSQTVRNPKLDVGCAEHCPFAQECLGVVAKE